MNRPDADAPRLPTERSASPVVARAGCVIACALAMLPILYVGSFAYLVVDDIYGWHVVASLDNRTKEVLGIFYMPLICLYMVVTETG